MAKQNASKQKKMDVRVDFTPMVDMMMLLITFFMLCTSLAKPQSMELVMPSNDKNMQDEDKSVTKASYTITMYVSTDEKKLNNPKDWPDSLYNAELSKIKAGDVTGTGEKIQTMTVIIKPTDGAPYAKVVEALDEMQICSIGKYVIDDINPDDEKLLEQRGIK